MSTTGWRNGVEELGVGGCQTEDGCYKGTLTRVVIIELLSKPTYEESQIKIAGEIMRQLDNRTTVEGLTRGVNLRYSGIRIPEDGES